MIDDPGQLEGNQRAGDADRFASDLGAIEGTDLGIVLHGPHGGVTEGDFEIAIAGFGAGAVPGPAPGINGARDQPTVGGLFFPYAHRRLALLREKLGRPDQAEDHWLVFLETVTQADPELQWMVDEAREHLEELARGR